MRARLLCLQAEREWELGRLMADGFAAELDGIWHVGVFSLCMLSIILYFAQYFAQPFDS